MVGEVEGEIKAVNYSFIWCVIYEEQGINIFDGSIGNFVFFLGFAVGLPRKSGLCEPWGDTECYAFYRDNFWVLDYLGIIAPIFFLIGLMGWVKNKSQKVFMAWWKFARIYIPIALVLIAISGGGGMFGGFGAGGGYDREGMIWFTSGLFFLITFIMLPLKFRKYREKAE